MEVGLLWEIGLEPQGPVGLPRSSAPTWLRGSIVLKNFVMDIMGLVDTEGVIGMGIAVPFSPMAPACSQGLAGLTAAGITGLMNVRFIKGPVIVTCHLTVGLATATDLFGTWRVSVASTGLSVVGRRVVASIWGGVTPLASRYNVEMAFGMHLMSLPAAGMSLGDRDAVHAANDSTYQRGDRLFVSPYVEQDTAAGLPRGPRRSRPWPDCTITEAECSLPPPPTKFEGGVDRLGTGTLASAVGPRWMSWGTGGGSVARGSYLRRSGRRTARGRRRAAPPPSPARQPAAPGTAVKTMPELVAVTS